MKRFLKSERTALIARMMRPIQTVWERLSGTFFAFVILLVVLRTPSFAAEEPGAVAVPAAWREAWESPAAVDRPLQIIHGGNFAAGAEPEAIGTEFPVNGVRPSVFRFIERYRDLGLGGVVLNMPFGEQYLRNEEAWNRLHDAVESCRRLGLIVWIYDEDGYPSGGAGTLVYDMNPAFESQELVFDASAVTQGENPFTVRPSYEFTHATNNYAANRRYANLLDDGTCRTFVELTHEAYRKRLSEYFADGTIAAFFTDEPSMMAIDLGQLPESVRRGVRIVHPADPTKRQYPAVPWVADMPEKYAAHWGEPLDDDTKRSLFEGDSARDREVRRRFWQLCADLMAERYFGRIEAFCHANGVESSGHGLWEELPMFHPALNGNLLTLLRRYSLPGLDELSSHPMVAMWGGWSAARFPGSAAALNGTRRVMSEMSDHSQKMGDPPQSASLDWMKAGAAWQMAMGVTDFTLYYSPADRSPEEYREYCTYVGRINAILRDATPVCETLLYYPIGDIAEEYRPVAEKPSFENQSPRMQRIVGSMMRLGERLTRAQTLLCIVDDAALEVGCINGDRLCVGVDGVVRARFLVIPADVRLSDRVSGVVEQFAAAGGVVLRDESPADGELTTAKLAAVNSPNPLTPPNEEIVHGVFRRDGQWIHCWVNVGGAVYDGRFTVGGEEVPRWVRLDPEDGSMTPVTTGSGGTLPLRLEPGRCSLFIAVPNSV